MPNDDRLLTLWAEWSEEIYRAGFMFSEDSPIMARFVTEFREWLKPKLRPAVPYQKLRNSAELAVLEEYTVQEVDSAVDRGITKARERFEKEPEKYGS